MNEAGDEGEGLPEQVDAEEARTIVAQHEAMVIDIRSEEEFAEERIVGSFRSDPDDVAEKLEEAAADESEDRDAILLVCEDGERSAELAEELRGEGHSVSSLDGGFDAWTGEHLPTAPGRDEEYEGPALTVPGAVASQGGEEEDDEDPDAGEGEEGERAEARADETADEERAERAEGG